MRPAPDTDRMMQEATALSFPRFPGTEGDRRAIAWVAERLEAAGLAVDVEPFDYDLGPVWRALRAMLLVTAVLVAAAGVMASRSPALALVAVVIAFVGPASLLAWAPWLERLYRRPGSTHTANVVGRRPATAGGDGKATIIVLAHHDSKSQNLTMLARGGLTAAALLGTLALAGLLVTRLVGGHVAGPLPLGAALMAAASLAWLATLSSGNESPGAVDNAGSVAILLELARRLARTAPPSAELVFLSTGAEEDHMIGAMRWLRRHREALVGGPCWALNLDGAGAPGSVVLLEWYGFGRTFSRALALETRAVAHRLGIRVRRVLLPPGMGIDAIPFAHAGVECLTLSSGSLGPATLAVHSSRDRPEHLDPAALGEVARLAHELILDLLREPSATADEAA